MASNTSLQDIVAARVRAVMAACRLDSADVSGPLGISRDALSRRISGVVPFSISEIEKFAHLTGYDPYEFFADTFSILTVSKAA